MIFYALVSSDASLAVDLYATREAAEAELREVLADEPTFAEILTIVRLDFCSQEVVVEPL